MLISCIVMPRRSIRVIALLYVLSVVPKPGIVTPTIPSLLIPSLSKVFTHTKRASVESNPPLIPRMTFLLCVCMIRFASPATCMQNISSQLFFMSSFDGINGMGFTLRSILNDVFLRLSTRNFSTSICEMTSCGSIWNRAPSSSRQPFSYINAFPP